MDLQVNCSGEAEFQVSNYIAVYSDDDGNRRQLVLSPAFILGEVMKVCWTYSNHPMMKMECERSLSKPRCSVNLPGQ